jgi:intracellular multiplication protein IcmD
MERKRLLSRLSLFLLAFISTAVYAQDQTIGDLAEGMITSIAPIVSLITAICYVAGIAFASAGVLKFKQHKENPQQVPLGTPFMLLFIGIALVYLPSMVKSTGATVFGTSAEPGSAEGGDIFGGSGG